MGDGVANHLKDTTLVLHVGLHKTATSYVQNVLGARRYDLLREGLLYPTTGAVDGATLSTREGAQSGHALFTKPGDRRALLDDLQTELPSSTSTVLLSSEDFTLPRARPTPEQFLGRFSAFGTVKVVVVLRRQDQWVESVYKQLVDQYGNFETRSFDDFLREAGPSLLDFHARFSPWRDLVGPENFHALSYDDLDGGAAIYRRLLEVAGLSGPVLEGADSATVPVYESVRSIDTLGLRILNSHRLESKATRTRIAQAIYEAAPAGDIALMTPDMREGIHRLCAPINERIENEWFQAPVPGLRFAAPPPEPPKQTPSGPEVVDYLDRVISLCEGARPKTGDGGSAG